MQQQRFSATTYGGQSQTMPSYPSSVATTVAPPMAFPKQHSQVTPGGGRMGEASLVSSGGPPGGIPGTPFGGGPPGTFYGKESVPPGGTGKPSVSIPFISRTNPPPEGATLKKDGEPSIHPFGLSTAGAVPTSYAGMPMAAASAGSRPPMTTPPPSQGSVQPSMMNPPLKPGQQPMHPSYPVDYGIANITAPIKAGVGLQAATPQSDSLLRNAQNFNAQFHFIRPSVKRLPNSASTKQKVHIPIGMVIQPLAAVPPGLPEIPSVNFGNTVVVRCKTCRTYINPFVQWDANGRRWACNSCGYLNDTPNFYIHSLDGHGMREDRFERPELCMGSVEFIPSSDYMVRPPQPPCYIFVIDVSLGSVSSGVVDVVCEGLKKALQIGLPGGSRTMIGFLTFDSTVHFYKLPSDAMQPQMLVVSDLEDMFLPSPEDIIVNLYESRKVIETLLETLPSMWRNNRVTENCMGSAINAAMKAAEHLGGKMCLFTSSFPNEGELKVKTARESKTQAGQKNTMEQNIIEVLKPANDSYKTFAQKICRSQISIELFVCPSQYVDLATISPISKYTAGDTHYYPLFNVHQQGNKLREELVWVLTRNTGWEAVMRIRPSRGWRISNWFGHFFLREKDLLVLPNCHEDQVFSIILEMEDQVVQDPVAYVQAALLYTNSNGERRIRVHTYCMPVSQNIQDIAISMDPQVVACLAAQQAIDLSLKSMLSDGRNYIQTICSQIISAFSHISSENSKILPIYILGMLKCIAFKDSKDVLADTRIFHWLRLANLSVEMQVAYFYPRMISLHDLAPNYGSWDEQQQIQLPSPLNLSSEKMTQEGAYLLEDGESLMLWLGKGISQQWLQSVFGVGSLDQLHPDFAELSIGTSGDVLGHRVNAIIQTIRASRRPDFMKLTLIRQGDPLEYRFFASLIEDRTHSLMLSLNEFIAKVTPRAQMQAPPAITQTIAHRMS